jgi:hypothetical protein
MDNHDLENSERYSGKAGIFEKVEGDYAPGEPIKCILLIILTFNTTPLTNSIC